MTVAWVTGGGTGIGRAIAEHLIRDGAHVVITGRRKEVLDKTVEEIAAQTTANKILAIAGDAYNAQHVEEVISRAAERWGPITLLVNNAGINFNHAIQNTPFEEYQKSLETNCLAAIRAVQAVLPSMLKADKGAIINISSTYGKWASSASASYSVAKYAIAGYTDSLRQALVGTHIHVMGVYPGFIKTDMTLPFVPEGSPKSYLGKTPDQMASAIFSALRRRTPDLYYPWYIPWLLRFHRWMPVLSDRVARRVKH